jgi:hypothetical protein
MPLSISSSEALPAAGLARERVPDPYARHTAADRPGVAQPVPVRPVPEQPWGRILLGALALLVALVGAWEAYWRAYGVHPGITNTAGLWAIQRRRIDNGEGDATVLLGASRVYFDLQLQVWERLDGRRPIQLSFEGTTPLIALEDLAGDAKFTGRVLVGVAPDLFFSGFAYRGDAIVAAKKESPSQRIGQWLSMRLIEPYFAFDDPDFALRTVLERQPWPARTGLENHIQVRKLAEHASDRNTHLWDKVDKDPEYRELARRIWQQEFVPSPDDPSPEEALKTENQQIERAAKAVAKLRARGVKVLFVRMPSTGPYLEFENRIFPRSRSWAGLLKATGAPGIYFEDYPEMLGYRMPEWSHMTQAEGERFTAVLYRVIQRDFWGPKGPATSAAGGAQQ